MTTVNPADADTLWLATKSRYADGILVTLTNVGDPSVVAINETVGTRAATAVIAIWPAYAQTPFDSANALHMEAGVRGVVAQLREWGGTSSGAAQIEWDEVFGTGGMLEKIRRTSPRAKPAPSSNSGVQQSSETEGGRAVQGWADRGSLPSGILPDRRTAD